MSRDHFDRRVNALTQLRVDDVRRPELRSDDEHHLRRVLRARPGEEIVLSNGHGEYCFATVADSGIVLASDSFIDPPMPERVLYLSPLKGDRSEVVVVKATELGITRVVPLCAHHLAVKFKGDAREKILSRWRRLAAEAVGQCRRTWDLVIDDPLEVTEVPSEVAVAEFGGTGSLDTVSAIAVGPEGGWAPGEWATDRTLIGLGEQVLRADTAAIAAATLLVATGPGWSRHTAGPEVR